MTPRLPSFLCCLRYPFTQSLQRHATRYRHRPNASSSLPTIGLASFSTAHTSTRQSLSISSTGPFVASTRRRIRSHRMMPMPMVLFSFCAVETMLSNPNALSSVKYRPVDEAMARCSSREDAVGVQENARASLERAGKRRSHSNGSLFSTRTWPLLHPLWPDTANNLLNNTAAPPSKGTVEGSITAKACLRHSKAPCASHPSIPLAKTASMPFLPSKAGLCHRYLSPLAARPARSIRGPKTARAL